jgi:hypothetical protein
MLFNFVVCGIFMLVDLKKSDNDKLESSESKGNKGVEDHQMVQIVFDESERNLPKESPQPEPKPSFCHLFMESYCLIGLFVHSSSLKRWAKMAIWATAITGGMAFIGARYEWQEGRGGSLSQEDIWTEYDYNDFLYSLSGLGVGLGVESVLMVLATIAGKASLACKKVLTLLFCILIGVGLGVALGGTIYMNIDLCYEEAGKWAIGFLPLFLGEVAICQPLVALARSALLSLIT